LTGEVLEGEDQHSRRSWRLMPDDAQLLDQYRPALQYDSGELYYADSARTFTDNWFDGGPMAPYGNTLRRKDGTVIAASGPAADPALSVDFLGEKSYANQEPVRGGDFLDAATQQYVADARRLHLAGGYGNHGYGVVRPAAGGKRWLQYWFFYYYNDKAFVGFGVHEGDWEGIQIRVDAEGRPDEVTYAQHSGGERAAWSDVELDETTGAPVAYVARGSHASYLRPGTHEAPVVDDVCDGGGRRVRPELEVLTDSEPAWVRWPGRWGASAKKGLISFPSPGSPRTQKRWRKPDAFHEDARRFSESKRAPGPRRSTSPTVRASRQDGVTTVQLAVDEGTPAKVTVTAYVDGDPRPLTYDLSELKAGDPPREIEPVATPPAAPDAQS
jgi:Vacuolar protein sorting-associated protein 62